MENNYTERNEEKKERISGKDILAAIIAQYSIMMPVVLGGCVIWGLVLWVIVKLMMH